MDKVDSGLFYIFFLKMLLLFGTSLAIQWLRLHAFTAGDTDSIFGWGTLISPAARPIHTHTHTHTHTSVFIVQMLTVAQINTANTLFSLVSASVEAPYPFGESPSKEYA